MDRITDFKPLQRLVLPGLGKIDPMGLVLIVGPNSSGKSHLLQDVFRRLVGEPRQLVVAKELEIAKPEFGPFLECLRRDGFFRPASLQPDSGEQLWPTVTYAGSGAAAVPIATNQARGWYKAWAKDSAVVPVSNEFLNYFGRMLVTGLFLDRRLVALNEVGTFDHTNQPPQNDLQALYVHDSARSELEGELRRTFSTAVWPDVSLGGRLRLLVADESQAPDAAARHSPQTMSRFRSIETEGDGLKSYVAICMALLLGRRPVTLVDEPEMCLHPPQAYNLGRFIARNAGENCSTLVATHSSHILRGVVQSLTPVQVVRLTRSGSQFDAHLVSASVLAEALRKPTLRAEAVLDGIFSQAVVVIEAEGDRSLYQAVLETLNAEFPIDGHFASVGGTGGVADICQLYRTLDIPIAVIVDLDVVADSDRFRRIAERLAAAAAAQDLVEAAGAVAAKLKLLPPLVPPSDVKDELTAAALGEMDWSQGDDAALAKTLRGVANKLDRVKRLKLGVDAVPDEIRPQLLRLIEDSSAVGLFLVPVGELERWLPGRGLPSMERKPEWAYAASALVQQTGSEDGDVWDFMRGIGRYLTTQLNRKSQPSLVDRNQTPGAE